MRCSRTMVAVSLLALLLAAGCTGAPRANTAGSGAAADHSAGGWKDWDGKTRAPAGNADAAKAAPAAAESKPAMATGAPPATGGIPGMPVPPEQQGPPRAGMVDDNADFAAYLKYLAAYQGPAVHPVNVAGRRFIQVLDRKERPVVGATVTISEEGKDEKPFTGRTYADGRVPFYPAGGGTQFRIQVKRGDAAAEQLVTLAPGGTARILLNQLDTVDDSVRLDVLFLIDATGSMGDEIAQLKQAIDQIATRIDGLGKPKPLTRYGMVVYRDRGDEFITRTFDFTDDVTRFAAGLAQVEAGGGGDTPESLNEAFFKAVHGVTWRMDQPTIRLIFLVADAPPHLDYQEEYDYARQMQDAVGKGIKLFTIAASGLDDQGEYVYRQISQYTQGRFVFLTYANGVSGAPGDKTTHHVEQYDVANLDDLIVQLVTDEVHQQSKSE